MSSLVATSPARIRIALAHSQRIVLEALGSLVAKERQFELAWSGTSSEELLETILRESPEVALVELDMPRLHALEVARRVRMSGSRTELVILGERAGPTLSRAVDEAGALAYVATDSAPDALFEGIRAAAEHRRFTASTRAPGPDSKDRIGIEALSPRELEVLRCLANGLSSREIADQLSLSFRTVDGYRASLMDKLFIRTVPGLVKFAIRHRVTDLER